MLWINLSLFLLFGLILAVSAILCVRSLSKISMFLGFSEFLIGFVIMGISTTLPELFVGINSALNKTPSISLGNVIGSVIINLTFIAGIIVVLARGIDTSKGVIKKDVLRLIVMVIAPVVLMLIGNGLSRIDGIILIGLFLYNIYILYRERRSYSIKVKDGITKVAAIGNSFLFVIFLVALFFGAKGAVKYGSILSADLGLPEIFIGLFFVAIGTSLPELTFGIIAARSKHAIMSLGDLIGACIVNATFVLGITAIIYPITGNFLLFLTSSIFMILVTFIFMTFVESGKKLDWKEGIALIFLYVFFLIVELSVSGYIRIN